MPPAAPTREYLSLGTAVLNSRLLSMISAQGNEDATMLNISYICGNIFQF